MSVEPCPRACHSGLHFDTAQWKFRLLIRNVQNHAGYAPCTGCRSHTLEGFVDQDDGNLDVSDWLIDRKGFLPIPIVITEPAVGYGGGLALMFVRNSMRENAEKSRTTGHQTPPDIFVLGAAATENGTKFAFGGGMATFGEDDR